ncbi:MAG TPA: neutral metalloprotease, partial [Acetobacterium sp.]|nr:neutral metalloprotease [Acetobacterium sp.]
MDMIYVDTYPLIGIEKNLANSYSTMAHEFQHMVNFNCNKDQGGQMETWLNETLSLAAEHLYEGVQSSRISYYNNSTPIADGRSVMDWNNSDSLPNYALSYLFSQYLRTQAEAKLGEGIKTDIYQQIIADPGDANTALSNAIKANIDANMTTEKFMTNFRVAMVLKANSGSYSFGKDAASFSGVTTKLSTQTS